MAKESSSAKNPDLDWIPSMIHDIREQSQLLIQDFLERQGTQPLACLSDPMNISAAFLELGQQMIARWMQETVHDVQGLDDKTAQKVDFYTRQFVDALAPRNFLMTNPQVLRATAETSGENLLKGLKNLLEDLKKGKGRLSIKMTDTDAFQVSGNIAMAPGKVIYQN
jgi:hypothetical protein